MDRTNTTFDVWQGITLGCTQCHSHPYDPIRHKEYYQFFDFFNQTKDKDNVDETPVFFSTKDYDFEKATLIAKQINKLTTKVELLEKNNAKLYRRHYLPWLQVIDADFQKDVEMDEKKVTPLKDGAYIGFKNVELPVSNTFEVMFCISNNMGCDVEVRLDEPNGKVMAKFELQTTYNEWHHNSEKFLQKISGRRDVYFVFKKNKNWPLNGEFSGFNFKRKENKLLDSLNNLLEKQIHPQGTPVMSDLDKNQRRTTRIFVRGSFQNLADTVTAGVPAILNKFPQNSPLNRLGMAQWLVSRDNPLTARVAVNRFWEQLFGVGIVETSEDFGSQGAKPSHPELLDNLAIYFMEDCGWSMKKLLKTILMSATYRQSSVISKQALAADPRNKYLLRGPRFRLTTEQIRDQALAVSGLLSPKMYGPSVMPFQPEGIWQTAYSGSVWNTSNGEDKHRRALYTYIRRSSPYPSYITFDNPSREFCMVRRIRTNTPLQALVTLNDTVYSEVAFAMAAEALVKNGENIDAGIVSIYKKALMKIPSKSVSIALKKLYNKSLEKYSKQPNFTTLVVYKPDEVEQDKVKLLAMAMVASSIINLDEFLTKE